MEKRDRAAAARVAVLVAVPLALGAWLAYDRVYARGGDRPVAWVDLTAELPDPAFRRHATDAFESRAELEAFLDEEVRGAPPPVPPIPFERRRALLATAGPRSSTGYAVDVVAIREERRRIVVRLRERTPRVGTRVEPRVTYPFRLVTIPRSDKRVIFEWDGR